MPADFEALAQLVFFVLIVLGWVVKAIVEAKQAKQRKTAPPPEPVEELPEEEDRIVRPRSRRTPPHRAPQRGQLADRERLGQLGVSVGERELDSAIGYAPGRLLHSSAAAVAHGAASRRVQRTSVLKRLSGGLDVAPGRDLTRAGVIWSEVLGPCRAMRGPHRSPAATRRRS